MSIPAPRLSEIPSLDAWPAALIPDQRGREAARGKAQLIDTVTFREILERNAPPKTDDDAEPRALPP